MSQYKRIFIIGHPGAGKGLFAKSIAQKLGFKFIDADFGLEFQAGLTIRTALGEYGEQVFLKTQNLILHYLLNQQNVVVTTDASIVCSEENRALLASELTVYLEVSLAVQLERIARNPQPLLETDVKKFLENLHKERDAKFSETAKIVINSDDHALEKHVATIINYVSEGELRAENSLTLDDSELILFHKTLHTKVHLSYQQALCVKLIAQGKTSKEIAKELDISYRTVEAHLAKAMELLGCTSSKELLSLYFDKV